MATYVNDLRLKEIGTGESSGTWGTETNVNLELIGEALGFGTEAITTNADTHTTTVADGSTDPGRAMYIKYTGTLDSACTITIGPNTMSRLHYIENATSGSQNIIISQGSGANITIPAGDTKAVYLDGAGSGAAVVDVFASFSAVDLKVQDDLTVTDDATIGGTLGVTGILTCTDDIIIGDGKTIGSASDVDAMTIAANGQVTFTQTLIGTALDISGDIDVDGTANLDVVDIDGATNIAAAVTMATNNKIQFRDDAIHISSTADGQLDLVADTEIQIAATTIDVNGNLDVSGTTVSAGKITADAGIDIDNINIDGTTIALSSGSLTLDVASDVILDSGNAEIHLKASGTTFGKLFTSSNDFYINQPVADEDIVFSGLDGSSSVTALTLDMSEAGAATFATSVLLSGVGGLTTTGGNNLTISGSVADHAGLIFATHSVLPAEAGAEAAANVIDIGQNGNEFKTLYLDTSIITSNELTIATGTNLVIDAGGEIVLDTDGNSIKLKDAGTQFGNLGASAGLFIAGTACGIRLHSGGTKIFPTDASGSANDDAVDLGAVGGAWKEVYAKRFITDGDGIKMASGMGIKFDGYSSANVLHDYEEGTWTPTIFGGTTAGTYTLEAARTGGVYTKVGRIVHVSAVLRITSIDSAGAGSLNFGGLPFTLGPNVAPSWGEGNDFRVSHYGAGAQSSADTYPPPFTGVGNGSGTSTLTINSFGKNYQVTSNIVDLSSNAWIYIISGTYYTSQ